MEPNFYNTVKSLEGINKREGRLLIIGFNEDLAFTILKGMNEGRLTKRDITIVDTFKTVPWQKAFDFTNEVRNKIKKHGEYIKQDELSLKHLNLDSTLFTILDLEKDSALDSYKQLFAKAAIDSQIHFRNKEITSATKEIGEAITDEYQKSKTLTAPTGELTVVKTISEVAKIKKPVRTRSDLT